AGRVVEGKLRRLDLCFDIVDRGGQRDLSTEATAEARPQEGQACSAEVQHRETEPCAEQPAEERTSRHLSWSSNERPWRPYLPCGPRTNDRENVDRYEAESCPGEQRREADQYPVESCDG